MTLLDDIWTGLQAAWDSVVEYFSDEPVGSTVKSCPLENSEKVVSEKAMNRLQAAQEAIDYTKTKLPHGAGNQTESIRVTNWNSKFRVETGRDDSNFNITPEVMKMEEKNSSAYFDAKVAATAELTQGGNCGEHAYVAYDYLRQKYPNEPIQVVSVDGVDHQFVMIGNPETEGSDEVIIADPWPPKATPVLWEDHFVYTPDNDSVSYDAMNQIGDSHDYKQDLLNAGFSLNEKGESAIKETKSPEEVEEILADEDLRNQELIWPTSEYSYTHSGTQYDYVTTPCNPSESGESPK